MEAEEQACDLDDDEGEDDGGGDADEATIPLGWEQLKFPHLLEGIPKEWQCVAREGGGTGAITLNHADLPFSSTSQCTQGVAMKSITKQMKSHVGVARFLEIIQK